MAPGKLAKVITVSTPTPVTINPSTLITRGRPSTINPYASV